MCDTFTSIASTKNPVTILAKNSDREPDEAQEIIHLPRQLHDNKKLFCTFIEIEQVEETYECLLSKPFQMWGAEMGVNEYGVSIGNEAVFTKVKFRKINDGLTGMDLLRLALERSKTATEAKDCIIELLEKYGQNACGGYKNKSFFYHNSFLISDKNEGWKLETAGKQWACQKVSSYDSISNGLTIEDDFDELSQEAISFARSKGYWKSNNGLNFRKAYSDWLYTYASKSKKRQACTYSGIANTSGQLQLQDCFDILQTHNLPESKFSSGKASAGSICMHATNFLNPSQTTGSMVSMIREKDQHTVWLTGTARPCLSIYIPFYFGNDISLNASENSLWWQAEKLHQWICKKYKHRKKLINESRLELQSELIELDRKVLTSEILSSVATEIAIEKVMGWINDKMKQFQILN